MRKEIDPVVSNYKLLLDLDLACAYNYSVKEIKIMYRNAGAHINPNVFESGFPAVHYCICQLKLELFEFLLKKGADIDSVKDKEGRTLLDLIYKRQKSGKIDEEQLVNIYRIVKSNVSADLAGKFSRQVMLREVYEILDSGEGDIVILSSEQCEQYRKVVNYVVSTFKVDIDMDLACALRFAIDAITTINNSGRIDGNVFFTGYPALQYAIRQGSVDFLTFLLKSCGADVDVTRDKRGRNAVEFLLDFRKESTIERFGDVYKCVKAHLPYMKVNIFERKLFLDTFYDSFHTAIDQADDMSFALPKEKILELRALIPPEVGEHPHFEPDVAHLMGYSPEEVLSMVGRGADAISVVTGFSILSRYIHGGNYSVVQKLIELNGFRCNVLFACDKKLILPLAYVKSKGIRLSFHLR
jgi:hypothetical protein